MADPLYLISGATETTDKVGVAELAQQAVGYFGGGDRGSWSQVKEVVAMATNVQPSCNQVSFISTGIA
jgi:hypothetical protein